MRPRGRLLLCILATLAVAATPRADEPTPAPDPDRPEQTRPVPPDVPAEADRPDVAGPHLLTLTGGRTVAGDILSADPDQFTFKTRDGHTLRLPWTRVQAFRPLGSPVVRDDPAQLEAGPGADTPKGPSASDPGPDVNPQVDAFEARRRADAEAAARARAHADRDVEDRFREEAESRRLEKDADEFLNRDERLAEKRAQQAEVRRMFERARAARDRGIPNSGETAAASADDSSRVYTTDHGKKYHRGSCRHLRKSKNPTTVAAARADGFDPCSACNPPE